MAQEIERKFLVKGEYKSFARSKIRIKQAYLSSVAERTVRIRIKDQQGFLTIKGKSNKSGASRYEWEKEIPLNEAIELMKLAEQGIIDKSRFIVPEESGLFFEVDEFYGQNEGLVIAEIELPSEDYSFIKPDWLGKEVTRDSKYYNSMLMKRPFKSW
jgi:CYTH domain-containing protein